MASTGASVPVRARGTASGIINTAAQLGIAPFLLIAALSTGILEPGSPAPALARGLGALISFTGALIFGFQSAGDAAAFRLAADNREIAHREERSSRA